MDNNDFKKMADDHNENELDKMIERARNVLFVKIKEVDEAKKRLMPADDLILCESSRLSCHIELEKARARKSRADAVYCDLLAEKMSIRLNKMLAERQLR